MKITKIVEVKGSKLIGGTLPDIDTDFEGKSRGRVKAYMEERFGVKQVCSVGSVSTLKLKGLLKDFDRQFDNDFARADLMTAIIDDKDFSMLDLFIRSASEPRLKQYIKENSDIFHMMQTLLNQPKTNSIHPCAMIIFPDVMKTSEWCPVRKQNGLIVSEWDGYQMDDAGFLKLDILGLKQLDKLKNMSNLLRQNNKEVPDIYNLPHDSEVYRYFGNGWTSDVFQFESDGMKNYLKSLKPNRFEDIVAMNALYRPGPIEYIPSFIKRKHGDEPVKYDLPDMEECLSETYGVTVYQEQVMLLAQKLGGLTGGQADDLRKAMGKKNKAVMDKLKDLFVKGCLKNGYDSTIIEKIWIDWEAFASYAFNKSHAAEYAKTAYASMFFKVNFPLEFWTVALDWADDKSTLIYLSEISQAKNIEILPPDINISGIEMHSDMDSQKIYWGLGSIKGIGDDTAMQVIAEKEANGVYYSLTDFIKRHTFTGSKVKKQTFEALISAGAFDGLYRIKDAKNVRFSLINRFRLLKKVKLSNKARDPYTIGSTGEKWWWLLKQKELTGLAFVDYRKIVEDEGIDIDFCSLSELNEQQNREIFKSFGGYVVECKVGKSRRGKYARIQIEHNYKMYKVIIWSEEYARFEETLKNCEKSFIVFSAGLRYEAKWTKGNQFTLTEKSVLKVLK